MSQIKKLARSCLVASALFIAGLANAHVITDVYDPTPDKLITTFNSPYQYTHNLQSYGLPGATIKSASLSVFLYDVTDLLFKFGETITFDFDHGDATGTVNNVSFFGRDYTFGLATQLLTDGLLHVSISAGCNVGVRDQCIVPQDVVFAKSVLTADIANVPEPGSLFCAGIGLLALCGIYRRKSGRAPRPNYQAG